MPTPHSVLLAPIESSEVGNYNCGITVGLQNYPSITTTVSFQCNVSPCVVTLYETDESLIEDQIYVIGSPPLTIPLETTYVQVPACGYAHTLTRLYANVNG